MMGFKDVVGLFLSKQNRDLALQNKQLVIRTNRTVGDLRAQLNSLKAHAFTDISTNENSATSDEHYTGNPYTAYDNQVKQIDCMYRNVARWGNMVCKNVIDVRAAFSTGQGLQVVKREGFEGDATRELEFIRTFMQVNGLDQEMPQEYAKEAEIEGRVLFLFQKAENWNGQGDNTVRLAFVPHRNCRYTVKMKPENFYVPERAVFDGAAGTSSFPNFNVTPEAFVYRRFGGSPHAGETPPKMAFVLSFVENLDKAIWDWREINRIHASPTPVISVDDYSEMSRLVDYIEGKNWKIGKALVMWKGKLELVGWHGEGYTTLKEEMMAMVKTISGTTGVPVHFFGYPELLSNRDTADNLIELIVLATNKERRTWVGVYEEIFQKAIKAYNEWYHNNLNPYAVDARMPFVTSAKMREIKEVWLPLYQANTISLDTLLKQLSGEVDIEQEIVKVELEKKKKLAEEMERNAQLSKSNSAGDGGGGDQQLSGPNRNQPNKAE